MRRAIAAIVTTAAGLVLLLSFKSHAGGSGPGLTSLIEPADPTTTPAPTSSAGTKPKTTTTRQSPAVVTTRKVTGTTYDTRYGPVQVRVTLRGKTIVDVAALQLPQNNPRDIEIDNYAVPQLRQEALDAQSANIDSVSGATYTSEGYIRSLQSALDKA
jgi:uncharacterized protein with FMN-binding domain